VSQEITGSRTVMPASPPAEAPRNSRPPRARGVPKAPWWQTALFGVVLLAAWQLLSGHGLSVIFFTNPEQIARRSWEMAQSGVLGSAVWVTGKEFILGYALGVACGVATGILFAMVPRLSGIVQPYLFAFYSVPNIALAPLFVIIFGIGLDSKVALVALSTFFFVFLTTYHGVSTIDRELISVARTMGASPRLIITDVLVPSALPAIFLGLRGAVPHALTGAVVGEFIASSNGLGWWVVNAANGFDTPGLFVGVVVLALASLVVTFAVGILERLVVRWAPSHER
jgi:NitT/TauT family transport system permease protein